MWKIAVVSVVLAGSGWAQVTERVSLDSGGSQVNGDCFLPAISADSRYVAFESDATNLVPGDTNGSRDIFVRDRLLGTTERVSVDSGGTEGNSNSYGPSISADGRFVAFESDATNLVPGDANGSRDIFVHDRQSGTTELVSIDSGGTEGNASSYFPSISGDGVLVVFYSYANNLVPGDTNGFSDIFLRDRQAGTTVLVSLDSGGVQGDNASFVCAISADGLFVAFDSGASNLVPGDTNGYTDVFVRDLQAGTTERVSVDSGGGQGDASSFNLAISGDGRYVAFDSDTTNLVPGDTNGCSDIFLHDRQSGTTERVSVDSGGMQGDASSFYPSISSDGRYVAFQSLASNLVSGDTNNNYDVFVRDVLGGTTERVSVDSSGAQGIPSSSDRLSITAGGRFVAFQSLVPNLVPGDTNNAQDIFVHDRDATVFTPLCEPGIGGVIACPCGNPPAGPGLGCNNFAPGGGTGGASLSGSGLPSIAADTVSLDISNTLKQVHVLFVGTTLTANVRTGAGVRCVNSGTNSNSQSFLKRIAKQTPTNGPPSTMSFTGIQAASAAKGAAPIAGETYYYYAAYRNAAANGQPGCPGFTFGFNATNAGGVTWYP